MPSLARPLLRVHSRVWALGSSNAALGAFGLALQLLSVPIGLSAAGSEAFGSWMAVYALIQIIALADLGVQASLVRGAAQRQDRNPAPPVQGIALTFSIGIVLAAVCVVGVSELVNGLDAAAILPSGVALYAGAAVLLSMTLRAWQATNLGEGRYRLDKGFILGAACARMSLYALALLTGSPLLLVVAGDLIFLMAPSLLSMLYLRRRIIRLRTDEGLIEHLRFGVPWFSTSFLGYAAVMLPTTVVGVVAGSQAAVGVGAACRVFGGVRQLQSWIVEPLFASAASGTLQNQDLVDARIRSITFARFICLPIALFSPQLFKWWLGETDIAVAGQVSVVVFMVVAYAQASFLGAGLVKQASGQVRILLAPALLWSFGGLLALIMVGGRSLTGAMVLYGIGGVGGAAWATVRVKVRHLRQLSTETLAVMGVVVPILATPSGGSVGQSAGAIALLLVMFSLTFKSTSRIRWKKMERPGGSMYSRLRLLVRPLNSSLQRSAALRRLAAVLDHAILGTDSRRVITEAGFHLWIDPRDHAVARHLLATGQWQDAEATYIRSLLREGDSAVDVGANIGYMTGVMATSVGSQGRVVSLEPEPKNFDLLSRNVRENGWAHVRALPMGAGSKSEVSTLFIDGNNLGNHSFAPDADRTASVSQVHLTRLDDLLSDLTTKIRLVKIDVQGWEFSVLTGMSGLRGRVDHILVEFFPQALSAAGVAPTDFLNELASWGEIRMIGEDGAGMDTSVEGVMEHCSRHMQADLVIDCRSDVG